MPWLHLRPTPIHMGTSIIRQLTTRPYMPLLSFWFSSWLLIFLGPYSTCSSLGSSPLSMARVISFIYRLSSPSSCWPSHSSNPSSPFFGSSSSMESSSSSALHSGFRLSRQVFVFVLVVRVGLCWNVRGWLNGYCFNGRWLGDGFGLVP